MLEICSIVGSGGYDRGADRDRGYDRADHRSEAPRDRGHDRGDDRAEVKT